MDPGLREAARSLAAFDPLRALSLVALREDAPGLALRGIALAQLGDHAAARRLLRRAADRRDADSTTRARALAAEAEVAFACRDLAAARRGFEAAARLLDREQDRGNALFVRIQLARELALVGESRAARDVLAKLDFRGAPSRVVASEALAHAEIAVRDEQAREARGHLRRAYAAARLSRVSFLVAQVERAARELGEPVARVVRRGESRPATLDDVEAMSRGGDLVLDARRREVRRGATRISLASRPVLFALARTLAEASPDDAPRAALIRDAFGAKQSNESLRARLRVEVGRVRRALGKLADVRATARGFVLAPREAKRVMVLAPLADGEGGALLALLADGEAWSTSALAEALGRTQRGVQRALGTLRESGSVQSTGSGRTQRWSRVGRSGFATTLLLVDPGESR